MKRKKIVTIVLQGLLSLLFLYGGISKLQHDPVQWAVFEQAGYAPWFFYAIGALELLLAGGIWWRRSRSVSLLLISAIMLGACYTHLKSGDAFWHYIVPLMVLFIAVFLLRKQTIEER